MTTDHDDPDESGTPSRHTRRWFLAGTGAVLLGAGGGVAADFTRKRPAAAPNPPPRALVEALHAEQGLVNAVTRAGVDPGPDAARLRQIERDHRQHLAAVQAALAQYDPLKPAPRASRAPATTGPRPMPAATLRKAEAAAAHDGATRAGRLRGRNATLLASIAACEATHVELLA